MSKSELAKLIELLDPVGFEIMGVQRTTLYDPEIKITRSPLEG